MSKPCNCVYDAQGNRHPRMDCPEHGKASRSTGKHEMPEPRDKHK